MFKISNKNRNKSFRLHQRERVINKKLSILSDVKKNNLDEMKRHNFRVSSLSKGKIHCSCKMCKPEKHYNIKKKSEKISDDSFKYQYKEFFLN